MWNSNVNTKSKMPNFVFTAGGDLDLALQHLEAAVKLATLHEEKGQWPECKDNNCLIVPVMSSIFHRIFVLSGAGSITPSNIPTEAGCTRGTFWCHSSKPSFQTFETDIFTLLWCIWKIIISKTLTSISCSRCSTISRRMWEQIH